MKKLSFFLMAMLVSLTSFAAEINLDFTKIDGFSSWNSSYTKRVVEYDEATVTFTSANRQTGTITNQPVTKGQPVEVVMKNDITLSGVTFACTKWGSKAQTITLHYSIDGGTTYTSTGITSTDFNISSEELPLGTNAVKLTFSSSSNQIGIASCTLVTVDANPDAPKYMVTATPSDEAMGTVTGGGEYSEGSVATLTATPNAGYKFVNWSNGSTDNPLVLEVTEDLNITANFAAKDVYTITWSVNGETTTTSVVEGEALVLPEAPEAPEACSEKVFVGWTTAEEVNADGSDITWVDETVIPANSVTYYAVFATVEGEETQETSITKTIKEYAEANSWANETQYKTMVIDENITITITEEGTYHNSGKYYLNGNNWRFYQNESPTITFSAQKGSITSIAMVYAFKNTGVLTHNSTNIASGEVYTVNNSSVTFTVGNTGTATNGNIQVTEITVAYTAQVNIYTDYSTTCEASVDPTPTVPTNAELWEAFKPYYNTFYGEARADQPITAVATFMTKGEKLLTDETSEYKWLGDYLLKVTNEQIADGTLKTYTGITTEVKWRFATQAFFNCSAAKDADYSGNADFTEAGKPENWGPYYLAAQEGTTPEPEPTTETVYFVNAGNWTTVNVYAWTTDPNASWPGAAATKEAEQIAGYDVYSFTANAGQYANVIFNDGSSQTPDLVWTAGKYYVKDGWYTKEEAEAKLAAPAEYESVYFVDNQGWGKANIYTWTPEVGTWPGVAMTKEAEQLAGYDVYSYTVEKGTSFGGVIFNNGSGVQTGDLKWTAGKYYVKDAWYTKEEAEAKLAGPVTPPVITYVLMGVKGDWTTGIAMTVNPDNENEYVLLGQEILDGDAVKVVTLTDGVATAWCGNVDESSVERSYDENGNIVLAPGKYDFYYKVAEDLIYIGGEAYEPEIEWLEMPLEITNLTTEVMEVEGAKYLQLMGRDDMNDADVILFLNNYADVDDDYVVNVESSYMTFGGLELTVLEGVMTQTSETDKGTMYNGIVRTYVAEDSLYVAFNLTMYAAPATIIELTDAIVAIDEELGTLTFNVPTSEGEGYYAELAGYTGPGVHEGPQICLFMTPEAVAYTNYAETSVADGVITLKGEFTSPMGPKFDVTISGKLPVAEPEVIEYVLDGGEFPAVVVPTNAELWEAFKPYYNTYYGLTRADQPIDKVSTFASAKMQEIMTDEASEYKWLGDYVQSVATAAGVPLSTDMASANESGWRWAVHAFFNAAAGQYGAAGIDFTEAGKPEAWGAAYEAEYGVVLPTEPVAEDYVLPTPTKEGYTFVGWYDNAEGTGEPYKVIPAGWTGTLYVIWKVNSPTTNIDNITIENKATKAIINGQLIIIKNGIQYNVQGAILK